MQHGESALQMAVREGHLDMVKMLVQVYRELNLDHNVGQYHMDLAEDHHHERLVEYLSSEFPTLKRKVCCSEYACLSSYIGVWISHVLAVVQHCLRYYNSVMFTSISVCRYKCHNRLCIPTCGLYLVIRTTSTNVMLHELVLYRMMIYLLHE